MATTDLYPESTFSNDLTVVGAATADAALDDLRGAYSDSDYIWGDSASNQNAYLEIPSLPLNAAVIKNVNFEARCNSAGGSGASAGVMLPQNSGGTYYNQVAWITVPAFSTKNNNLANNPHTIRQWTPGEINAMGLRFFRAGDIALTKSCSAINVRVTWEEEVGGFALFVSSWLPPLLAVASHGLLIREIVSILARLSTRPSSERELRKLREAFEVRPRFCFV